MLKASVTIVAALILLTGCDQVGFMATESMKPGTLAAVESCMNRNKSELVEDDVIRDQCVAKHERDMGVDRSYLSGTAKTELGGTQVWAYITNDSPDDIITSVTLVIDVEDRGSYERTLESLWIMPGTKTGAQVAYVVDLEEPVLTDNWSWRILSARGIEITVD